MKHLVLLAATLGMAAMTAHAGAAELLRVAGIGHGPGYHATGGCQTCAQGGPVGPGSGYGGYAGCCGADYPQRCCEDVWAGYCDEPRCHFWQRLHARLTTEHGCGAACNTCSQPEYGCNAIGKLLHRTECCVEEEASCEAEVECCDPCQKGKLFKFPSLGLFKKCDSGCEAPVCEPSCEVEEATECCTPCCKHKGIFGWLHRACGGDSCSSDVCTDCATAEAPSVDLTSPPPAPESDAL